MRYTSNNNTCNNSKKKAPTFLFKDFLGDVAVAMKNLEKNQHVFNQGIRTNITEIDDGFAFHLALPGVNKDQISLDINEQILTLTVGQKENQESDEYRFKEFDFNGAKRSFKLSKTIDTETINAEMKDGILTITMSKKPAFVPKSITIK